MPFAERESDSVVRKHKETAKDESWTDDRARLRKPKPMAKTANQTWRRNVRLYGHEVKTARWWRSALKKKKWANEPEQDFWGWTVCGDCGLMEMHVEQSERVACGVEGSLEYRYMGWAVHINCIQTEAKQSWNGWKVERCKMDWWFLDLSWTFRRKTFFKKRTNCN